MTKSIFTSKLGIAGMAVALLGALQTIQAWDWASLLKTHPTWVGAITTGIGVAIFVLRLYTTTPAAIQLPGK